MLRSRLSVLAPLALALAAAVALPFATRQTLRRMEGEKFEVRYIPSPKALRVLSPGLQLSIANYYWLLTVQYLGEEPLRPGGLDRLYPLADLVTELDPQHGYAYQTAGIALSSAERLEESDAILKKGMGPDRPNWWSYPFYLAFNDFFYRGDYASAARWAELAARTPGASPNISKLALSMKVKSGSPEDAMRFIEEMRAEARDEKTQAALDEQYKLAVLSRDLAALDAAVERFRAERRRDPARLAELVEAGMVSELPPDPFGGRYEWKDGKVRSSANDFRFGPAEPGKLQRRWRPTLVAPESASPSPTPRASP